MTNQPHLPWHDPNWMKQAVAWIQAEALRLSIPITGEIEQPHTYPWSTVLHVPTRDGKLFFKATAPETLFEAALTHKLADWFPDCMPEPVAVDAARGWMLMRDGGEQLRASIRPTRDLTPWETVIPRYAEVQIGLAAHVPEMLELGVPDYRLAMVPALYGNLLADEESLLIDQPKGLSADEVEHLCGMVLRVEQLCADLASFGLPETLNHGDFHDGNVLVRDGRITFLDWADGCISHPFVSLRTFFVSIEIALELDDYSFTPAMSFLLDRYLMPWQEFVPLEALRAAFRLSRPVASIVKAANWYTTIVNIEGSQREEYAWIVPELLKEFLVYEKMLAE